MKEFFSIEAKSLLEGLLKIKVVFIFLIRKIKKIIYLFNKKKA